MGKRETKESYKDSKDLQERAGADYDRQLGRSEGRENQGITPPPSYGNDGMVVPPGGELSGGNVPQYSGDGDELMSSSGGSSSGGMGSPFGNSPYAGRTGGDYGDVTGAPWTRGNPLEGRSSNVAEVRGLWGGFGGPGEGSYSTDSQRDVLTGGYADLYNNIAKLKDPGKINTSELTDTLSQFQKFRDTGGLSAENINRMRGMGVYDEFAKTGGYSDKNIADIKAQALSPIGAYATGTRDELSRRQALQGGYGPGFDAANRQMQKDAARNIAATSLDANVGIQDRINQGRQWGTGGIANTEGGLAALQSANRMGALGGEAGIGNNLSDFRSQDITNSQNTDLFNIQNPQNMKLASLSGLGGLYEGSMGRQENAYNREFASQQNALDRGLTSSENAYNRYHQTDESGLNRGLTSSENALDRSWNSGENALNRGFTGGQNALNRQQQEYDRQIAILNSKYGNQLGGLNNQSQLGMQPGIGGNLINLGATAAGIGSQFFMPKPKKPVDWV